MAAIILGNVKVQGVNFASGDVDNYVLTSTGAGDYIKGEGNLRFTGTTLVVTGDTTISGSTTIGGTLDVTGNFSTEGTLSATGLSSGSTTSVVNYNTSTGSLSYNTSGGGTSTYLRADGTWGTPAGTGDVTIHYGDVSTYVMWSNGTGDSIQGDAGFTYDSVNDLLKLGEYEKSGSAGVVGGPVLNTYCCIRAELTSSSCDMFSDDSYSDGLVSEYNSFRSNPYFYGATASVGNYAALMATPFFDLAGGGSNIAVVRSEPYIQTGVQIDSYYGVHIQEYDGDGTLDVHYGLNVETLDLSTDSAAVNVGNSDDDQTIVRVGVTGTPKFEWDESEDEFTLSKGLNASGEVSATTLVLSSVPEYSDNTTAKAGGLSDNDIYRTSTGVLMVVYT